MNITPQDIIVNTIANVLASLLLNLACSASSILRGRQTEDLSLDTLLRKAISDVSENIEWEGSARIEELCLFLGSPEVEAIVRQIFSAKFNDQDPGTLDVIGQEFRTLLSLYTDLEGDELATTAEYSLNALLDGCQAAFQAAVDQGVMSAHEARSTLRHRILVDELKNIEENLKFLTASYKPDIKGILDFEAKFRSQVATRHGYITPPHFDAARKIPIDRLYVPNNFIKLPKTGTEEREIFTIEDFLLAAYRVVLLADPGGGKSTFAAKLCYDLASRYAERLFAKRQVTPILVVLREYGARKKTHECSILEFIQTISKSDYQIASDPYPFEYMLLNGRAIVIFDGLDELLDTSYRQEISNDIEVFCNLYSSIPVVITSRKVGYEQAPLDEERFDIFQLASFDDDQVEEYVQKWFALDPDLTLAQREQKSSGFIEESELVPDLRSNPLMLALMCNIYRGEGYIPKNRPELYEKCANMLFERWDKNRGLYVPLPIEGHIRYAMMYLAYWIYANPTTQGGVTESDLEKQVTDYLLEWRFTNYEEAREAAAKFIEYCTGRAWVFTDTGTTKEGERLYQFTHRTFLEYFTAAHLVRISPTTHSLGKALLPKIAEQEWDVVAQLAFQLKNKDTQGAGDQLLEKVLMRAEHAIERKKWSLLSFAARCLEFIVPSPKVTQHITEVCIERCLDHCGAIQQGEDRLVHAKKTRRLLQSEPSGTLLSDLLSASSENRPIIAATLQSSLVAAINDGDEFLSLAGLDITVSFTIALHFGHRFSSRAEKVIRPTKVRTENLRFWENLTKCILESCHNRVKDLCSTHWPAAYHGFDYNLFTLKDVLHWHGVSAIFVEFNEYLSFPTVSSAPIAGRLPGIILGLWDTGKLENVREGLRWLGQSVPSLSLPLVQNIPAYNPLWGMGIGRDKASEIAPSTIAEMEPDVLFGLFVTAAVLLELMKATYKEGSLPIRAYFKSILTPVSKPIARILMARLGQVRTNALAIELEQCNFTHEQKSLVLKWMAQQIDFVTVSVDSDMEEPAS